MTARRRIVIVLATVTGSVALAYVAALVYMFFFWNPKLAITREVTDVLASDAVAFVPEASQPIRVLWLKQHRSETLVDRGALAAWLCANSKARTSVLMGESKRAQGLLELQLVELAAQPLAVPCSPLVRFYAVRDTVARGLE